jgi:hypothetical protein
LFVIITRNFVKRKLYDNVKIFIGRWIAVILLVTDSTANSMEGNEVTYDLFVYI